MWSHDNAACEVCECSSLIKSGCKVSEQCCSTFHCDSEKENSRQSLSHSLMKNESDLSLYSNSSLDRLSCGSPNHCLYQRRPLEDHDQNSQDSGYGAGYIGEGKKFYQFAKSLGVTPRQDCSPVKTCSLSFESMDSMDDDFLEFTDLQASIDQNVQLPTDFSTLTDGPFNTGVNSKEISPQLHSLHRPAFRRAISFEVSSPQTPIPNRVRSCLFKKDDGDFRSFKRPEPPNETRSHIQSKRSKVEARTYSVSEFEQSLVVLDRPSFRRSVSASEESIKYALHRSSTEPDLIGDFSKSFCLPLTSGRHQDLISITPSTLAVLMRGGYQNMVSSYKVIDCRYPYEFNGGHIEGATNLYTKEQVLERLLDAQSHLDANLETCNRNILVFHCEFSSERGPNLYRFLRKSDRLRNSDVYPALYYPEVYLLEGGYKSFFEQYSELCVPDSYLPMLDPNYSNDLKHFRAKSRTWNGDRLRFGHRGSFKRLGFS
ncbi:hypothetical protein FQA39_LY18424 [Lamprigera yunnana]|nr:hypothetical protein FQA39_LY18424 [Lamprigera yunnana]